LVEPWLQFFHEIDLQASMAFALRYPRYPKIQWIDSGFLTPFVKRLAARMMPCGAAVEAEHIREKVAQSGSEALGTTCIATNIEGH
jgi:hypothetical protein